MKNLKILMIFAAFIFAGISASGQAIGFKMGGTFSKINSDPDGRADDLTIKPGVQFGVLASMAIFPMMDIQPEVVVYQKGVKYKDDNYFSQYDYYYVDVPINIRIKPPVLPLYVIGGPYLGYAFQGNYKSEITSGTTTLSTDREIDFESSNINQFDLGLDLGLGFIKDFGPLHFFVEGRYNYGLMDISGSKDVVSKHSNIGVVAGIMLGFK